jgi:2-polyprenyl-6-methoxyphenol hydroxylase-like FAD-dependent oxidoreductase
MATTRHTGTALVVGAGIGGLAAAIALRRAGWSVRVFERAASPRELGFALLLAPNAMRALRQLGLAQAVIAGGVVFRMGEIRRIDGRTLRRTDAKAVSDRLGAPTVCALRPVLHSLLLEAVGADALWLGSEVTGVVETGEAVEIRLADGRTARGDLLIGADGVGSIVRRLLHPDEPPPSASGLFALRGVAFEVAAHLGGLSGAQYFGDGLEAGLAQASERAVYWYLSIPAEDVDRIGRDPGALARALSAKFHEPFRAIVRATAPGDLRLDELFERKPIDEWGRGSVTLLGDAAHPMLPHAGQGAAQALEDAVALGQALEKMETPAAALRAYERVRAPRRVAIAALARRNARLGSIRNPLGCWLRDLAIRSVPERFITRSLLEIAQTPGDSLGR